MDTQLERLLNDRMFRYSDSLTIGYLIALRGLANPEDMTGINERDYAKGYALGLEDAKKGPAPLFLGYLPDDQMPVKVGQLITIPKGTVIHYRGTSEPSKRTRKIKIHHFISGSNFHVNHRSELQKAMSPKVVWPGSGGYWSEVDLNDVPEAKAAVVEAQRQEAMAEGEEKIKKMNEVIEEIRSYVAASLALVSKEGFHLRYHGSKEDYFLAEAVTDDHAVLASFTVEHYYENRKLTLRINVTSSICQALPNARIIFKALSLLMATAEKVDANYCQPWNKAQ